MYFLGRNKSDQKPSQEKQETEKKKKEQNPQ